MFQLSTVHTHKQTHTQKPAVFPKPGPGICAEKRRTGAVQAPGPWGMSGGPWEEGDGQDWSTATGWHFYRALYGFQRELIVWLSEGSNL